MASGPNWPSPLFFPSRQGFFFNPGVPDRQMWAIGMVVAQWSMTETLMHNAVLNLTGANTPLWADYRQQASFKHHLQFYKTLVETKVAEPKRTQTLALISEIQRLKSQRDKIMHGTWGGGFQPDDIAANADLPSTDASLIRGNQSKPFTWSLSFGRLKELAIELSNLNGKIAQSTLLPEGFVPPTTPHGNVNV